MSPIHIPIHTFKEAKRILARLRPTRPTLPVISHVRLTADDTGIRLTASDLDHWIETRISSEPAEPTDFLVPHEVWKSAIKGDRNSSVALALTGRRRSPELEVTVIQGGIVATSCHPTLPVEQFPPVPEINGESFTVPPETLERMAVIASCASADATRHVLNGVLFSPRNGGTLVATDGRRLACAPAVVPHLAPFILSNTAVSILGDRCFSGGLVSFSSCDTASSSEATAQVGATEGIRKEGQPDKAGNQDNTGTAPSGRIAVRCGNHLLVTTAVEGKFPAFEQVIPTHAEQLAVVPHDRRTGLVSWLRTLGADGAVRLDWKKNGLLSLSFRNPQGGRASLRVPVEIYGNPPVIAFNPRYLADALEIGTTLCLGDDGLSPGICRHPTGRFCVLMPMRVDADEATSGRSHPVAQTSSEGRSDTHESGRLAA